MLKWVFGADIGPFKRGLDQMRGEVSAFSGSVKGMLGAAFGGAAVAAWVSSMVDEFGRIQDLADQLGMSAESIQKIGYAAKLSGSDIETAAKGWSKMIVNVAKAEAGNEDLVKSFDVLGISVADFKKLSPEDQLVALSKGFTDASDNGRRAKATMDILGKAGKELTPLLKQGPEALKEQLDEATIATNEQVAAVAKFGDEIDKLKARSAPAFGWIVNSIMTITALLAAGIGYMTDGWGTAINYVGNSFGKLGDLIGNVFSGNMEKAKEDLEALGKMTTGAVKEMGKNISNNAAAFKSNYNDIWDAKHESPKPVVDDAGATEEEIKNTAKLKEDIAKLEEDARIRGLALEEKINDAIRRRAALLNDSLWDNGDKGLEAQKKVLEINKELEDLQKEQKTEQEKADKDRESKAKELGKLRYDEMEKTRQLELDGMSKQDRLKALKADQAEARRRAKGLQATDPTAAAEQRIKALDIQKDIDGTKKDLKSELESLQKIQPVIATSSLASIGAGGSANLFSSESTNRRMVDLLAIIASNTAVKSDGRPIKLAEY